MLSVGHPKSWKFKTQTLHEHLLLFPYECFYFGIMANKVFWRKDLTAFFSAALCALLHQRSLSAFRSLPKYVSLLF